MPGERLRHGRVHERHRYGSYRAAKVQIEGDVDDNKPSGDRVGLSTPGGRRDVHDRDRRRLRDVYGQSLVGARRLSFMTTRERFDPYLERATTGMLGPRSALRDPAVGRRRAGDRVAARELYQVAAERLLRVRDFEAASAPRRRASASTTSTRRRRAVRRDARVDLRPALRHGHGPRARGRDRDAGGRHEARQSGAQSRGSRLPGSASRRASTARVNAWMQDITPAKLPGADRRRRDVAGRRGPHRCARAVDDRRRGPRRVRAAAARKPHKATTRPMRYRDCAAARASTATESTFTAIATHEKTVREQPRALVRDRRSLHVQAGRDRLRQGLGALDAQRRQSRPGAAGARRDDRVHARRLRAATSRERARATLTAQGGFDRRGGAAGERRTSAPRRSRFETRRRGASPPDLDPGVPHARVLGQPRRRRHARRRDAARARREHRDERRREVLRGRRARRRRDRLERDARAGDVRPPGWDRYAFTPLRPRSSASYWRDYARRCRHGRASATARCRARRRRRSRRHRGAARGAPERARGRRDGHRRRSADDPRELAPDPRAPEHATTSACGCSPRSTTRSRLIVTDIDGNAGRRRADRGRDRGVLGSERYRDDARGRSTRRAASSTSATRAGRPARSSAQRLRPRTPRSRAIADARGRDERGAATRSRGGAWRRSRPRGRPRQASYRPGDVAKLDDPLEGAAGDGGRDVRAPGRDRRRSASSSRSRATIVELPIEAAYIAERPRRRRSRRRSAATSSGSDAAAARARVRRRSSSPVDVESARLAMRTRPTQPLVEPGADATFEVEVRHDDKPVAGAEVALMVVDEAVLVAVGEDARRSARAVLRDVDARHAAGSSTLDLVRDAGDELAGRPGFERCELDDGTARRQRHGSGYGAARRHGAVVGAARVGRVGAIVKARKDFRAERGVLAAAHTDANGKVRLTVKMPDSLTRFRIVALATANTRYFGKAESAIVTQRKINARTVAPRFLTQGDTFSLPVVVQNLDATPRTVDVAVRAAQPRRGGPRRQARHGRPAASAPRCASTSRRSARGTRGGPDNRDVGRLRARPT